MGYRSQVTILFTAETKEDLDAFLAQAKLEYGEAEYEPDGERRTDEHLLLEWGDVKWYESYDDIKFWTRMMELCNSSETVYCEFCRVGEETNDIVTDTYGEVRDYHVYVNRDIQVDI